MQIFLARNNVQAGPYTLDQLNGMLATGEVLLDDLMWHEGMANWQRLGDVTGNQAYYAPGSPVPPPSMTRVPQQRSPVTSDSDQRVTVDRLYGKPNTTSSENSVPANSRPDQADASKARSPISLGKPSTINASATGLKTIPGNPPVILAPVMSRVLALVINGLLYLLSMLPLLLAFTKLDIDMEKFQDLTNFQSAYEYSVTLVESIPDSTIIMSQVMMFGLFAIQLLLIIRRGQSLGKLMTGIRVVDQQTHRLPPLGRLLGMRTLFLIVVYNLIFSLTSILGFLVIALHYFIVSKSPQNIGLHDKIAKTLVVKAADDQLNKLP